MELLVKKCVKSTIDNTLWLQTPPKLDNRDLNEKENINSKGVMVIGNVNNRVNNLSNKVIKLQWCNHFVVSFIPNSFHFFFISSLSPGLNLLKVFFFPMPSITPNPIATIPATNLCP